MADRDGKVFISWSGNVSKYVAEAIHEWLPNVLHASDVWISAASLLPGDRWNDEIARNLDETDFGIVCLTRSNLNAPWLLFEAGALSKSVQQSRVCPLLIDLSPHEVPKGPLSQLQITAADKKGFRSIVGVLNDRLDGSGHLQESSLNTSFEKWWPDLAKALDRKPKPTEPLVEVPNDSQLIQEILATVRAIPRQHGNSSVLASAILEGDIAVLKKAREDQTKGGRGKLRITHVQRYGAIGARVIFLAQTNVVGHGWPIFITEFLGEIDGDFTFEPSSIRVFQSH